jgi:hypothetical protein
MDTVAVFLIGAGLYLVYWAYKASPGTAAAKAGPIGTVQNLATTPASSTITL